MIILNRRDVYERRIDSGLKYILNLKLNFDDAVKIIAILSHISKMVDYVKTPFYVQIMNYGGEIIPGAKVPPFYKFEDEDKQNEFERTFNAYIDFDEIIDSFDIVDCEIKDEDYEKLPSGLVADLRGIVNFVVE